MKLIFELIEGESLAELYLKADLDLDKRIKIAKDLAEALMILHSFGIVHGDIKPENILITKNFQVKIIDFGISWKIGLPNEFYNEGTILYIAPEFFLKKQISRKIDV